MKRTIDCEFLGKVILIKEIKLKPYRANDLRDMLKDFVDEYSKYTILFPMFHKADKEYKVNMKALSRTGFKRMGSKPTFVKKLVKRPLLGRLTFKTLKQVRSQKLFRKLFVDSFSKSKFLGDFLDTLDADKAFDDYVINKKKKDWNFLAYDGKKLVGMIVLMERHYLGRHATLNALVVDKRYRGNGYALEMLRMAEQEFLKVGLRNYRGSTDSKNVGMIKTFKKFGCKRIRESWMYVFNPEIGLKKYM